MTAFNMNKSEIEQAAIEFKKALINWKSREKIEKGALVLHPDWTEENILRCIEIETRRIKPVIEAFEPIYRLAIQGKLEKPFALQSYMMSYTGRVLGDELSWPEVREPYDRMIDSLTGSLEYEVFTETPYYKNRELPEYYDPAVKEIVAEGWTHNSKL